MGVLLCHKLVVLQLQSGEIVLLAAQIVALWAIAAARQVDRAVVQRRVRRGAAAHGLPPSHGKGAGQPETRMMGSLESCEGCIM